MAPAGRAARAAVHHEHGAGMKPDKTPDHKQFISPQFRRRARRDGVPPEEMSGGMPEPGEDIPAIPAMRDDFGGAAANDDLPRWKLSDLYTGLESEDLAAEMAALDAAATTFRETYEGTVAYLSGPELGEAVAFYEKIENVRGKVACYAALMESDSLANFAKTEPVNKWLESSGEEIAFFEGEILEMPEKDIVTKLGAPKLARYAPWIARVRADSVEGVDADVSSLAQDFQ